MIMEIKVKTGAPEEKIIKHEDYWEVWIKEKPVKGRANVAIIKLLEKELGKNVRILKGAKNKRKIIEISP